ncbi:hypothetical protein [Nocardia sp. NPDC057455]|uniref:hypothetical protein n=1 Tax=Nocardia sp. NPDC057455 TaxID=3346138 RepID=UPI00366BAB60
MTDTVRGILDQAPTPRPVRGFDHTLNWLGSPSSTTSAAATLREALLRARI